MQTRGSSPSSPSWPPVNRPSPSDLPERRSSGRISSSDIPMEQVGPWRPSTWWIIVAHILGAAILGALDCAKLASAGIVLAVVPLFASMGLLTGVIVATLERFVGGRSWWLAALVLTAPALIVFVPVAGSLFEGAYAQTLPVAAAAPYLLPVVLWVVAAASIAVGRRVLRAGDLTTRALGILVIAGAIGVIIWAERNVLRTGYATAHIGATVMLIVLFGLAIRITWRGSMPYLVAAVLTGLTIGGTVIACLGGLSSPTDRQLVATRGDQSRDVVSLWRKILDLDRDGASSLLGGGDCDDHDNTRYPGAVDNPNDGIDQDCDGKDAVPVSVAPPTPAKVEDLATWRATPAVAQVLDKTRGMHVLVITVDALRADLLAPDAADRTDFPVITKLLSESVWFTRAFSPASGTDISLATFLTGRFDPFQPVATTLPEAMKAGGRFTFAALPKEVQRYAGEALLGRGVDKLVTVHTDWDRADVGDHVSAPATTAEALRGLTETAERPGFIWVHYFDVHEHHQIDVPKRLLESVKPGPTKKTHVYRGLLKAIDNDLGHLFAELAKRNLADKTMIVFASDHGESLGMDPRLLETHGKVLYAPLVRIPVAFRIPGVTPGTRTEQISLVDLAPTLFSLTGIKPVDMQLDGLDLVPVLLDAPTALRPESRALAMHEELQWSVVEWPHQLIVRPADNIVELYDLEKDPDQRDELSAKLPEVVTRLKAKYAAFPSVAVDRTPHGRSERERLARQRPPHAP
ncbi:MAG TPA: sulfatase-like hydrolase/transferase [Kofleriaceae bacterium]